MLSDTIIVMNIDYTTICITVNVEINKNVRKCIM